MIRQWRNQRGDTLVEVVMSIAILAAVMSTAYTMGNVALRNGINAREHTEAVYLSQQQAERLIAKRDIEASTGSCTTAAAAGSMFSHPIECGFDASGGTYCYTANLVAVPVSNAACSSGDSARYAITIASTQPQSKLLSSTIDTKWQSILGDSDLPDTLSDEQVILKQIDDRNIPVRNCDVVGQLQCR